VTQESRLEQYATRSANLTRLIGQEQRPTKRERKVARETYTRAGAIQAETLLHEWASEQIDLVHLTGVHHYATTVARMNRLLYVPVDEETAKDVAAFLTAEKAAYARHKATLTENLVANITAIASAPLPLEEEKPKGILGWLLGGTEN
jgi:hypothetical protein